MSEPRRRWDPSTFKRTQEGDRTAITPTDPVCDFCLLPQPEWEFPAAPLQLVGHPLVDWSDDEWAACTACKELVEAGKIGELVERSIKGHTEAQRPGYVVTKPLAIWRRETRENMRRFMDARTGPPREYRP